MYKNVLNQYAIALIVLFASGFSAVTTRAQTSANSIITYASANIKSAKTTDEPPTEIKVSPKAPDADTTWQPVRRVWGLAFGDFYYNAHADAGIRGGETNWLPATCLIAMCWFTG